MIRPSHKVAILGVLSGVLLTIPASAEPPASKADAPGQAKAAAAPGEAKAAAAPGHTKSEGKPTAAGEKGDKSNPQPAKAEGATAADTAAQAPGSARGVFKSRLRELREELKDKKLKKEEIKDRLAKMSEDRKERRQRHREALKEVWGDKLADSAVLQEIRHHERRMALLNRMLLLTETEKTGKDKDKLSARIEKLIEKENARHERKMAQFKSGTPGTTPGTTTPAGANPTTPGATPPGQQPTPGTQPAGGVK